MPDARPGRNDACPCGSGIKHKKCCYDRDRAARSRAEDERVAVEIALAFLRDNYPDEIDDAVDLDYLGSLDEDEFEAIDRWPSDVLAELEINIGEWLLADAVLRFEDESIPALDLVLGTDGPRLPDHSREWLLSASDRGLSLYEVRATVPGEGVELEDLAYPDEPPVRVQGAAWAESALPGDIFGARLVRKGDQWILSDAWYPMSREDAHDCLNEIFEEQESAGSGAEGTPDLTGPVIIDHWLKNLVRDLSVSQTVDAQPEK